MQAQAQERQAADARQQLLQQVRVQCLGVKKCGVCNAIFARSCAGLRFELQCHTALLQVRAQLQAQGHDPQQAEAAIGAMQDAAAAAGGGEVNVQDMGIMEALLRSLVRPTAWICS